MKDEFIFGKNPLMEALRAGHAINKIWIQEGSKKSAAPLLRLAKENSVLVQTVPKRKLEQMAEGANHQGVIASVAAHSYVEVDELFRQADEKGEAPFFILLDEITDPHNLGSILRTADAAGAHGVIVTKHRSVGLTGVVAKTSAGALEYVPVCRVTNLGRTIDELKKRGLWFVASVADGETDYREADFQGGIGLVLGSEGNGVSRLVKEKCDFLVRLPMAGHVTSLNASVAAALFMYEVYRQRQAAEGS